MVPTELRFPGDPDKNLVVIYNAVPECFHAATVTEIGGIKHPALAITYPEEYVERMLAIVRQMDASGMPPKVHLNLQALPARMAVFFRVWPASFDLLRVFVPQEMLKNFGEAILADRAAVVCRAESPLVSEQLMGFLERVAEHNGYQIHLMRGDKTFWKCQLTFADLGIQRVNWMPEATKAVN